MSSHVAVAVLVALRSCEAHAALAGVVFQNAWLEAGFEIL